MLDPIPFIAVIALGGFSALYVTVASLVSLVAKKPRTERDAEGLHHTDVHTQTPHPITSHSTPSIKRNLTGPITLLIIGLFLAITRSVTFIIRLLGVSILIQLPVFLELSSKVMLYSTMVILKRQFFPRDATSARRKCLSVIGDSALICIATGLALAIFVMVCNV